MRWNRPTENDETVRQGRKNKGMRDRESGQGGRQAYHLCVGGHKLRKNKEEEERKKKRGCKINREEAERGRGKKRESGQRVKMNFRMFQLKKQDQRQLKTVDMIQINSTEKDAIALSI